MYRNAIEKLAGWRQQEGRKPLVIRGVRQCGKTWLMKEFGATAYPHCAYVNFENNPRMKTLFALDFDIERILLGLRVETGLPLSAEDTLLMFDEVQEVPRALSALKYFHEQTPQLDIIAAGSMLGVALHPDASFPVGQVEILDLFPLSFAEFLRACGHEALLRLIASHDFAALAPFSSKLSDLLRQYLVIGGMPEVVHDFITHKDFSRARGIQTALLAAYELDFSKHTPHVIVPRIRAVWSSMPAQLARENRKFVFGVIRPGARAREYELAIQWLIDCGLMHRVTRIAKPGLPLSAYQDPASFKLYLADTGLLCALSGLEMTAVLRGNELLEEFKGALTEQFVLQQLISQAGLRPFYWSAERATAEVDFVVQLGAQVVPIEVKAAENLHAKSLKTYHQAYAPQRAIRTSLSNYRQEAWLTNLPLYAIHELAALV